ncbi:MAG: hypothetical protein ACTSQP_24785, partial [Promethearchaeota archaeon]
MRTIAGYSDNHIKIPEKINSKVDILVLLLKFTYFFFFMMLIIEPFITNMYLTINFDLIIIYFPLFFGGFLFLYVSIEEIIFRDTEFKIKRFLLSGIIGSILIVLSNIFITLRILPLTNPYLISYLNFSNIYVFSLLIIIIILTIIGFKTTPNVLKVHRPKNFIKLMKIIYPILVLLGCISLFLPACYYIEDLGFMTRFIPMNVSILISRTYLIPNILQIISVILFFINPYYLKRIVYISLISAIINIIYITISQFLVIFLNSNNYQGFGIIVFIISQIGISSVNILLRSNKKLVFSEKIEEVRNYILELSSIYDKASLREILNSIPKVSEKSYPILKSIVEEMISKKEIEAELTGDILFFKKKPELLSIPSREFQAKKLKKDFDPKKRLFGMIKTRKNINIKQAAEFLKVSPDLIEGLIYDLIDEGKVEGRFKDDVFIFESDIDQFISILDESYKSWESQD